MSLDLNLLTKILEEKSIAVVQQLGVSEEVFDLSERKVWSFIETYYKEYREMPTRVVVEGHFGFALPEPAGSLAYLVKEICNRRLQNNLNDLSSKFEKSLTLSKPREALDLMRDFVKAADKELGSQQRIVSLNQVVDSLYTDYADAKAGKMGIPTPWEKMNDWTRGWFPGDLSFISGRLGTGKTFFLILLAIAARRAKYSVLFVSGEMSVVDVARRYSAMSGRLPYSLLRKGKLSEDYERRYFQHLEGDARKDTGFEIMDSSLGFKSSDVEIAIDRSKADLILIDASYRMKSNQKARDRFENMAMVADDLKSFATQYQRSIVATTQLNRESAKKKNFGDDDIALSDVVGWNSSNLFALKQTDEHRSAGIMAVHPLKVREGENLRDPLTIRWNMNDMDFSETQAPSKNENPGLPDSRSSSGDKMPW